MDEIDLRRHLSLLLHDLQRPVASIRAAISFARRDIAKQNIKLDHDYLDDAWHYSELLGAVMLNAALLQDVDRTISPNRTEKVSFLPGVLYPAIDAVEPLLRDCGATRAAITLDYVDVIPPLYVDRKQMQLVFFNLLANAITYSLRNEVRVRISGDMGASGWTVSVQDWGIGVDPAETESNIEMSSRGRRGMSQVDSRRSGVRLHIARTVLVSHGCDLLLTHSQRPTEFRILFPMRLAERACLP